MWRSATISIDDDLAPGQSTIALRAANDETTGWIDQITGIVEPILWHNRLDDHFDHRFFDLFMRDLRRMLGRQHDGVDADRLAIDVAQGHLRLRLRLELSAAVERPFIDAIGVACVPGGLRRAFDLGRLEFGIHEEARCARGREI